VLNLATVWRAENKADDFLNLMTLFRSALSPSSRAIWLPFDCFLPPARLEGHVFEASQKKLTIPFV
jgi:hypothetical protein